MLLYSQIIARLPLFSGMFLHIRKSLCHATRCGKPFSQGKAGNTGGRGYGQNNPHMQCRGAESLHHSRREGFHAGVRHERLPDSFSLSHMHYVGRSFRLLNPSYVRPCALSVFRQKISPRKFSAGNRRENAESRRDGRTLMRKGKIIRFINTISSDGIAYFLLHLFQLMGQDFHVAADLLVGYPGIYLGGFQIRMPQRRLTVSMGTPCESSTVVAFVCRAT